MWEKRSKQVFLACVSVSMVLLIQMTIYLFRKLLGLPLEFNLIQLCSTALQSLGFTSLEYLLEVIIYATVSMTVYKIVKQLYLSHTIHKKMAKRMNAALTAQYNRQFSLPKETIRVIDEDAVLSLTMGFFRPKIILSAGLLNLLDERERQAVVFHEIYHQKNRDPLKLFILSVCSSVMWYIPILSWFYQKYRTIREVLADHYAISSLQSSADLGSALLKILKTNQKKKLLSFSYAPFADTAINLRIQKILDPFAETPLDFPLKKAAVSMLVFFMLLSMFLIELS
ncbi:M56 family metallopeptidase [Metabacillus idriensis]|uniref:M56 family metallopeptidase n=1 Tax=Metabacillus idriensis TaxID=324768 RepID=UPI002812900D|nr:M56 family metallopeptidase [Metabacillus idriensis]MDR0140053.1 M56 family metallopeptidase [Metabacillus idriensis]